MAELEARVSVLGWDTVREKVKRPRVGEKGKDSGRGLSQVAGMVGETKQITAYLWRWSSGRLEIEDWKKPQARMDVSTSNFCVDLLRNRKSFPPIRFRNTPKLDTH